MARKNKKKKKETEEITFDDIENGFLYKPVSDGGGGLVILLPSKYKESQVRLIDSEGNVIEQGRSSGYANGDREHFRFSQQGGKYPDGVTVEVTLADGSVKRHRIENSGMRYDAGGASSGELKGSSGGGGASVSDIINMTGLAVNNVTKPTTADKFKARTAQADPQGLDKFKSPMTQLETIRSVTNIIVGSSRSFDELLSQQMQKQQLENLIPQLSPGSMHGPGRGRPQQQEQEPVMIESPGYN